MAEFKTAQITNQGETLIAKVTANLTELNFSKACTSSFFYTEDIDLKTLTSLNNIEQTSLISGINFISPNSLSIRAPFINKDLVTGYYIYTVGLYAVDPDDGEILFSIVPVISKEKADFMPEYNGISVASFLGEFQLGISNTLNVNLTINPSALVTPTDIINLTNRVSLLETDVGNMYTKSEVDSQLSLKANLSSPDFTGNATLNGELIATQALPIRYDLTLLNGFTAIGVCCFWKGQDGGVTVTFRLGLNGAQIPAGGHNVAMLPEGVRPKTTIHGTGQTYSNPSQAMQMTVLDTGIIRVYPPVTVPADSQASLTGNITYYLS